jgi:hypothetical protein
MYPNHDSVHASVPLRIMQMSAIYCGHCQAWRLHLSDSVQTSDDHLRLLDQTMVEFGPFDSPDMVAEVAVGWLDVRITLPADLGLPAD